LVIYGGADGDTVDARALTANKSIYYYGGNEDDTLYLTVAGLNADHLTLGGGQNSIVLTTASTISLANVSGLNYLYLADNGTNALQLSDSDVGSFLLIAGGEAGNTINASAVGSGKAIFYYAGSGQDVCVGGAEDDTVYVPLAAASSSLGGGHNELYIEGTGSVYPNSLAGVDVLHLDGGGRNTIQLSDSSIAQALTLIGGSDGNTVYADFSTGKSLTYYARMLKSIKVCCLWEETTGIR
jgi:hypothetical protein